MIEVVNRALEDDLITPEYNNDLCNYIKKLFNPNIKYSS